MQHVASSNCILDSASLCFEACTTAYCIQCHDVLTVASEFDLRVTLSALQAPVATQCCLAVHGFVDREFVTIRGVSFLCWRTHQHFTAFLVCVFALRLAFAVHAPSRTVPQRCAAVLLEKRACMRVCFFSDALLGITSSGSLFFF